MVRSSYLFIKSLITPTNTSTSARITQSIISVIRALLDRMYRVVTEDEDKKEEEEKI